MKLKVAQVIGLNTDQKASQVTALIQDKENAFFALLTLECDDAFTRGRQTLSEATDLYFDTEGTPSDRLSQVLKFLNENLSGVVNFDFILASLSGKVFYLLGKGQVEVYLKRGSKISQLLSVGAPIDLISGFLQPNDRVLMASKNLTIFLKEDLSEVLNLDLERFEEEVSDQVSGGSVEDDGLSGLLIEVEDETAPIPQIEETVSDGEIYQKPAAIDRKINLGGAIQKIPSLLRLFFYNIKKLIPESGRGKLVLAVIIMIIVASGALFQFFSNKTKQKDEQFNLYLVEARNKFDSAKGLASLNPAQAKLELEQVEENINKALSLKPKDSQALDFKKQLEEESGAILQQFTAFEFPVFLDLDLVKKGFTSTQMSLSVNKLLLLDPNSKTLITVDLDKKSNQVLAGESQLGKATLSSINSSLAFVYSEDKGIIKVDSTNQKASTVAKPDSDLGKVVDISAFAGNIYILDALKNQIWKYLPTEDGYSAKREYLTSGTKADLASSIRMQIESSVYVLQRDGQMIRFTKGERDNFSYQGLDKGVNNPKSFFVSSDTEDLYLLDSGNSRLLILSKTGEYKGQINGEKFASFTDLVVDEEDKKVYLLEGSKIYTVDLK